MATLEEQYQQEDDENEQFLTRDSDDSSLAELSAELEDDLTYDRAARWQTTRFKTPILIAAAVISGVLEGMQLEHDQEVLREAPPNDHLISRAPMKPGEMPQLSPASAGVLLGELSPIIVPFIMIPLYNKIGLGGALVCGMVWLTFANVIDSISLNVVWSAFGSVFFQSGFSLIVSTMLIWMSLQSRSYLLVGVVSGLNDMSLVAGVRIALLMSKYNWSLIHAYQIMLPFTFLLAPCFWFTFRDENNLKYTSEYPNQLTFRDSFKINSIWLLAVMFAAATGSTVTTIWPAVHNEAEGVSALSLQIPILVGSIGKIIIGYGINTVDQRRRPRMILYFILPAIVLVFLAGVIKVQAVKIVLLSLSQFFTSPITVFLYIITLVVVPKEHYPQAVRSIAIATFAVVMAGQLGLGIVTYLLSILLPNATVTITHITLLTVLYFCFNRLLK